MASVQFKIDYMVQIWREGELFIAHAMPLDVMSQGESAEAARQALDEAVRAFLLTAVDRGTLDTVLEEAGYHRANGGWMSPHWVGIESHTLSVAG